MSINIILKGFECEGASFSNAINYYLSHKSSLAAKLGQILAIAQSHGNVSPQFVKTVANEVAQISLNNDSDASSYQALDNLNQEVQSVLNYFSSFASAFSGEELACFKNMEVSE